MVIHDRLRIGAEGVVDGGEDFHRVDGLFDRAAAGGIALAVDVAALDARAGEGRGVAVGPMVAAIGAVDVAAGGDAALAAAAEFADGETATTSVTDKR